MLSSGPTQWTSGSNRRQRSRHSSGSSLKSQIIPHNHMSHHAPITNNPYYHDHYLQHKMHGQAGRAGLTYNPGFSTPQPPRRPRSADPSPQRTASRIESLREMHGGPLMMNQPTVGRLSPSMRHLLGGSASNIPLIEQQGYAQWHPNYKMHSKRPPFIVQQHPALAPSTAMVHAPLHMNHHHMNSNPSSSSHPHHHHQVLYVCQGQCTGPHCDFSQSTRQLQSVVYLDPAQQVIDGRVSAPIAQFHSEVVETAPSAFQKLDKKRAIISQMKEVLSSKLESKYRSRLSRRHRNDGREKGHERSSSKLKSLSSDRIECDSYAIEMQNQRCSSRRSNRSDFTEDLSQGSKRVH